MTLIHCNNCNKDIPIMEIDSNFHSNGYCKIEQIDNSNDPFFWKHIGIISLLITFGTILFIIFVVFPILIIVFEIELEHPATECLYSHIETVKQGVGKTK